ncbi:MAG TPA: glutamate--tRNA ligase [Burkholderiales bacterium]|nr:glutamate--tRNA ligase [Burkholderiales bacterium]
MRATMVRTRFAPSPTGFLHIGGARTALFSWAYARRQGGRFVLRIEDTDLERSTEESVRAILDGMAWLGLDWDEGPLFQMQRLSRYREVAERLLREGRAYRCYCTKEELEQMRAAQRARGEKPRYDGRWRDSKETPPPGVAPVIRFKNPLEGEVTFHDLVKGAITIANAELDDLVLLREDGVPTYNFGVVVDDLDMRITHVIRGDDHVNNTPRQINIFRALGAELPQFAHVPMILGADGERLSKRHGAVSVMQYADEGYLPEALLNYLARLGWSHGDAEIFTKDQLVEWFDLAHVHRAAAHFDPEKLRWLNHQYVKQRSNASLADLMRKLGVKAPDGDGPDLEAVAGLLKERSETVRAAVSAAAMFYGDAEPPAGELEKVLTEQVRPALRDLMSRFSAIDAWNDQSIMDAVNAVLRERKLKLPQVAMPLRLIVFGRTQTPNIGPTLAVAGKKRVTEKLRKHVGA